MHPIQQMIERISTSARPPPCRDTPGSGPPQFGPRQRRPLASLYPAPQREADDARQSRLRQPQRSLLSIAAFFPDVGNDTVGMAQKTVTNIAAETKIWYSCHPDPTPRRSANNGARKFIAGGQPAAEGSILYISRWLVSDGGQLQHCRRHPTDSKTSLLTY